MVAGQPDGMSDVGLGEMNEMDHRFVGIPELTDVPRVAVIIDVRRAFTVAAWAFSRAAEKIVLASSDGEALALKESPPGWLALKDGAPAACLDTVNSPGPIRSTDLVGRTVVQKTTDVGHPAWAGCSARVRVVARR
jgi:2-phosphosulfolactate phosphatase